MRKSVHLVAPPGDTSKPLPPLVDSDRLDSWKEIAAYFDKGVRTVQRWAAKEGMPVHRHEHESSASVYALRSELEAWLSARDRQDPSPPEDFATPPPRSRPAFHWTHWLALLLVFGALVGLWRLLPAGQISGALFNPLSDNLNYRPKTRPPISDSPPNSGHSSQLQAHRLYLKGRHYWEKRNWSSLKKSIDYFRQAIDEDPLYSPAYSGLSDAYIALGNENLSAPREVYPKAKAAAKRALALDPNSAEAFASLGVIQFLYDWNWTEAERSFRHALELAPDYAPAHKWYGMSLSLLGQEREALAELQKAKEADPLSLSIEAHFGWIFYRARQYDAAAQHLRKLIELNPNYEVAHSNLAWVYLQKGQYEAARLEFEHAGQLVGDRSQFLSGVGIAYALSGQRELALQVLQDLEKQSKSAYVPSAHFALIYSALGEIERAFQYLNQAYEERYPWLTRLKVDPLFDKLRNDARFQDLYRRVGLLTSERNGSYVR